jgi:hypothetical protein
VKVPVRPLAEDDRKQDLEAHLARGNHKSAEQDIGPLLTIMRDEVVHGWQLPLPIEAASQIPGAMVGPMGIVPQLTISEKGEIIDKNRPTHDQSFNPIRGVRRSVNDRVDTAALTPYRYGTALLRFVHHLILLRRLHPNSRILMTKIDWKSAYRRLHFDAASALQAMVVLGGVLLVALRLTFGGAANPSRWSDLSEMACDLANDLIRHPGWSPSLCPSPHMHLLDDAVEFEPDDVPLAAAAPVFVDLPADDKPKADMFIDDGFAAFLERDVDAGRAILPFVLHLLGRPVADDEPLPRDDVLSVKKFLAEATPAERKIILGWVIDSRRLTISLPEHKVIAWSESIRRMLANDKVTQKELEVLLGRLNHVGQILPMSRHFLSRLRQALAVASKRRGFVVVLTQAQREDLDLWLFLLRKAGAGVSLNLMTYRQPSVIFRVDACEHGVGGYDLATGTAWRFEIPEELRLRASLNSLEFLAAYLALAKAFANGRIAPGSCILVQGDSTSASGWLQKSNFAEEEAPFQLWLAREVAQLVLDHGCVLASQWFPGKENIVSDCLSRDHHLNDADLTRLLVSNVPDQVPQDWHISPLPPELLWRTTRALLTLPASTQSPKVPTRSELATGAGTLNTSTQSSWTTTSTSNHCPRSTELVSSVPSLQPTGTCVSAPTIFQTAQTQYLEHVAPPSTRWLRPIGISGIVPIQQKTNPDSVTGFYRDR